MNLFMAQKIWQKYIFARLDENNNVEYFHPVQNMLRFKDAKGRIHNIINPNEAQMNYAGWYRLVNVFEDGTDYILDNILYHYVGAITEDEEEGEE